MNRLLGFGVVLAASISFGQALDPLKLVDPMIGTRPEGHAFPGETARFGRVQLSPETQIGHSDKGTSTQQDTDTKT